LRHHNFEYPHKIIEKEERKNCDNYYNEEEENVEKCQNNKDNNAETYSRKYFTIFDLFRTANVDTTLKFKQLNQSNSRKSLLDSTPSQKVHQLNHFKSKSIDVNPIAMKLNMNINSNYAKNNLETFLSNNYMNKKKKSFNNHNKFTCGDVNRMKRIHSQGFKEKKDNENHINHLYYDNIQCSNDNLLQLIHLEKKTNPNQFLVSKKQNNFFLDRNHNIEINTKLPTSKSYNINLVKRCSSSMDAKKASFKKTFSHLIKAISNKKAINNEDNNNKEIDEVNIKNLCEIENDKLKAIIKENLEKNINRNQKVKTCVPSSVNLFKKYAINPEKEIERISPEQEFKAIQKIKTAKSVYGALINDKKYE